jgi:hypothetical protein
MFVKMLVGPRAGEVVEMKYADALPLFSDSRAEPAYPGDPAPTAAAKPDEAQHDSAPKKKTKKK